MAEFLPSEYIDQGIEKTVFAVCYDVLVFDLSNVTGTSKASSVSVDENLWSYFLPRKDERLYSFGASSFGHYQGTNHVS